MKIGTIDLGEKPVMLAPMEDVTDAAFRLLCKEFGADMVYTEFISCDALVRNVESTLQKLCISSEKERPVAMQIYGREPEPMAEAARMVERAGADVLDINFGCPVKKVAGKGAGAGLLRDVPKMLQITRAVVQAVGIPVTVKTRLGWDEGSKIIVDLAERLQDCGIQGLTIHGRTRAQMYTGRADWSLIGAVKANPRMAIPIVGNGDISSAAEAAEAFSRYGVDGIMLGRATFGRPWIFEEVKTFLQTGRMPGPKPFGWYLDVLRRQARESVLQARGRSDGRLSEGLIERRGIVHVRRHLAASLLFKGLPDFRQTRIAMLRAETLAELEHILDEVEARFGGTEPFSYAPAAGV